MSGRRVCLWNWHTPYVSLLATALQPDWHVYVIPTSHAPTGWRGDQRPMPENVFVTGALDAADDVVLCQTTQDCNAWFERAQQPMAYLSHNHAALEGVPTAALEGVRLVAISDLKAQSWREAGYAAPITVIPPGINVTEYAPWTGEGGYALTVVNGIRRPLFNALGWQVITHPWRRRLIGEGNGADREPARDWDHLRELYAEAAVYINPTTPPYEDAYNLASLEAAATGTPVINLCYPPAVMPWTRPIEDLPDLMSGKNVSSHAQEHQRQMVAHAFPFDRFAASWRRVLTEVANG